MAGQHIDVRSGLRGPLVAGLAVGSALIGHVAAGAPMPGFAGILVPMSIALAIASPLLARRSTPLRLVLAVGLGQIAFHFLFVFGAGTSGASVPDHEQLHTAGALAVQGSASPGLHAMHLTVPMIAWHTLAAAITIAVLQRGEQILEAIAETADRAIAPFRAPKRTASALPIGRTDRTRPSADAPAPRSRPAARPSAPRGPPSRPIGRPLSALGRPIGAPIAA